MEIRKYVENLAQLSRTAIPKQEGDYYHDGILYCGKCHTPKQIMVRMPWGEIKPNVLCKCALAEKDRIESEHKAQQFSEMVERNRKICYGLAEYKNMQGKNFAVADKGKEIEIGQRYVENFPQMLKAGKGLTLRGEIGSGKSYAAACICNALLDKGYKCLFTNFSRIRNEINSSWEDRQEYIDGLNSYSLLVFDDLGAESKSDYMKETVHAIIDARLRAALPVIVTTNLTAKQLFSDDGSQMRIYSRLFEMTFLITVQHPDRRKEKAAAEREKFRALLGI